MMTDPTESDRTPVTSFSTTDVETNAASAESPPRTTGDAAIETGPRHVGASDAMEAPEPGTVDPETGETEVWQDRYAFGNFAARFLVGFFLIGLSLYFLIETQGGRKSFYPLTIITGAVATLYWLWVVYHLFRSRFSHHYRLTSRRLFVSSGVFRRQEDMMELDHLKEVTVQQQHFFDHVCKVGHVVVESSVKGAPTLVLVGVNKPHKVSDLLYQYARKKVAERPAT